MHCDYGSTALDDYFDQQLSASAQAVFLAHCRQCAECRAAVDEHTRYVLLLKTFKLSSPVPGKPRSAGPAVPQVSFPEKFAPVRRSALLLPVAAAVAGCVLGLAWFQARDSAPASAMAQAPTDVLSKVNIVIQVPATLDDARLTVSLPQGVYILGQQDLRTLAWNTDFAQGTNALELPIRIDGNAFDRSMPQYLDATLEYRGASKTFEFLVGLDTTTTL